MTVELQCVMIPDCSLCVMYNMSTCIWTNNTGAMSYEEANTQCASETPGGSLVVIESREKDEAIQSLLGSNQL